MSVVAPIRAPDRREPLAGPASPADDAAPAEALTLHVATVDGRIDPSRYPAGRYALRFYNQGAPAAPPPGSTCVALASRGLAKSRNACLDAAGDGIAVIGDDDVRYLPGFDRTIRAAYAAHPDADLVLFAIRTPEGRPFGRPVDAPRPLGRWDLLHRCSIEITFRARAVRRARLRFDERFGLGARFPTGEDIVFLDDAYRAGLRIRAVPDVIAEHPAASSGARHDLGTLAAKGAMFARMHGAPGLALASLYALRKWPSWRAHASAADALRATLRGAIGLLREGPR